MHLLSYQLLTVMASLLSLQEAQGYRILILGAVGTKSHRNLYTGIVEALSENGHQVTIVTPYPSKEKEAEVSSTGVREVIVPEGDFERIDVNLFNESMRNQFSKFLPICSNTLQNKGVQSLLKEPFDLVLLSMFFTDCYYSVVYQLGVPYIGISPVGLMSNFGEMIGNPVFPSFVTMPAFQHTHPLTFFQRVGNVLADTLYPLLSNHIIGNIQERECRDRRLCPAGMPPMTEIKKNASMMFINSVRELENPPRPYVPGVVHIGGIHCRPAGPLPKDLEEFVEGSGEEGFIYFSLGSAIKSKDLEERKQQLLFKVLSSLKQRVLLKWGEEPVERMSSNIRLGKWFPQQDILGHPKLRLFITHGGLMSTLESIYHGTPVLSIPFFGDQRSNAREVERRGWGKVLDWHHLTEEDLLKGIRSVMDNKEMQVKVKLTSNVMRDQPMSPKATVNFWSEYIVRHNGAKHLRSPMIDMPYYKIYNMDVWFALSAVCFLVLFLLYKILRLAVRFLRKCCKSKKD